ncbi:isoaspartyl peptidase/L-asparaginase [Pseudoalteromonas sp. C2R02]|uniref:isoaspartyl peptidase/L-asparaginase family protein n=1 Tax=Pseudoalteromonas sp. C2R02 TaxID=2841565 RepID=UPI001C097907|nr:isoaspartyl peptidase/L-asparaginase [Pseudoalteromonas sp. C2R02]MBU2970980.1 isoaspartyl peptidase/L-asparaginase [Pseudoalteromonas sp. C2R02]
MKKIMTLASLICALSTSGFSGGISAKEAPLAIAIHGGAGTIERSKFTPEKEKAYRAKLKEAVEAGYRVLNEGGESLDAVTTAINILENSPFFNAGKGAVYTYDGKHEMDASIMDGRNRQAGAVAGVKHIENPINLARLVMDKSVHVMLAKEGAEEFAKQQGIKLVDNKIFDTEHRYQSLLKAKKKLDTAHSNKDYQANHQALPVNYKMGTVGAVALDINGNIAAGTSTGGMTAKRFGRIGDSPVIGAGTFADNNSCAVSATGHGEYFIRYNVAADICARVQYQGKTIVQAGNEVIHDVLLPVGGTGGVIIIDTKGNISLPFNTKGMYRASKSNTSATYVGIFKED